MRDALARLSPLLHLTRVSMAFAAVGNVWFVILWTRSSPLESARASGFVVEGPLWLVLIAGAVNAGALFSFATALNDTLDVRRDRAMKPDRPIASGRVGVTSAASLVALALTAAMLAAAVLGLRAVWMSGLTAIAILGYHTTARFLPSLGLVALGLIYAGHMLVPNDRLAFLWPVWLVMTHALMVGWLGHVLGRKRPALRPGMVLAAVGGWLFWSAALVWLADRRLGGLWMEGLPPIAAAAPLLLLASFPVFALRKARRSANARRAAERIERYGALWLPLYATAWLAGAGHTGGAAVLAGLALAGLVGMTILREAYALMEQPIGYRRS